MPRLDGTGPMGMGPMTGGGFGPCNPSGRPYARWGFIRGGGFRRGFGPGFGRGGGYGRGFGRRAFHPAWGAGYGPGYGSPYPMDPKEEVNLLKDEADALQSELDSINKRMEYLEATSSPS